jgi:hypothetical protein
MHEHLESLKLKARRAGEAAERRVGIEKRSRAVNFNSTDSKSKNMVADDQIARGIESGRIIEGVKEGRAEKGTAGEKQKTKDGPEMS